MIIIDKTFWFINAAITAIIVGVIAIMILRLIADAADFNPFGWASRTIRRLSDWLIIPMRGGLRGFGIDPKYGPLVVILLTILLGYFVLQLVETIAMTAAGILMSTKDGAFVAILGWIIFGLLSIYMLLITIRIVFSWGMVSYTNRVMRFLVNTTEPLLGPLRRIVPMLGPMDISPIVALLILWLFRTAVAGTLLASSRSFGI
jgi:YggT family protein